MSKVTETAKTSDTGTIEEVVSRVLELMGLNVTLKVAEDVDSDLMQVDLQSEEEAGLLIGGRGRTLNALQSIVGLILRQKGDVTKRVLINVNDWREKEEERIKDLALGAAERVRTTGQPQPVYNLTPAQRRIVHLTLSEESDLETRSEGEGNDRFLVILPRK